MKIYVISLSHSVIKKSNIATFLHVNWRSGNKFFTCVWFILRTASRDPVSTSPPGDYSFWFTIQKNPTLSLWAILVFPFQCLDRVGWTTDDNLQTSKSLLEFNKLILPPHVGPQWQKPDLSKQCNGARLNCTPTLLNNIRTALWDVASRRRHSPTVHLRLDAIVSWEDGDQSQENCDCPRLH